MSAIFELHEARRFGRDILVGSVAIKKFDSPALLFAVVSIPNVRIMPGAEDAVELLALTVLTSVKNEAEGMILDAFIDVPWGEAVT